MTGTTTTRSTRSRKLVAALGVTVAAGIATLTVAGAGGTPEQDTARTSFNRAAYSTEHTAAADTAIDLSGAVADESELKVFHRAGEASNGSGTGSWATMYEFMETVLLDADAYWSNVFANAGLPVPYVTYSFPQPGEQVATTCTGGGGWSDDRSAYYCQSDDAITFSQAFATELWSGTFTGPNRQVMEFAGGDMAVAMPIAHEMAHSLQAELGLLDTYGALALELHADCWAGVWTRSASDRGLLDEGDVNESLWAAWIVGAPEVAERDHGTSAERMQAFSIGFDNGQPAACGVYL